MNFPVFKSDLKVLSKVGYRFFLLYFTNYAFNHRDEVMRDEDIKKAKRLIFNYRFFWTTNISFIFFLIFFVYNLKNVILFWLNIAILFLYIFVYIYFFLIVQHHLGNWKDEKKIVSSYFNMLCLSLLICLYILPILNYKKL